MAAPALRSARRPAPAVPSHLAVGESSVILLHPLLPLAGVSIVMERGCQQNDSLADGYANPKSVILA